MLWLSATLQIRDLFGLVDSGSGGHFLEQLYAISLALPTFSWQDLAVGLVTLAILLAWPRLKSAVPAPLVALLVAGLGAWLAARYWPGFEVATIASRFNYQIGELSGQGIPPVLPQFDWPWHLPGGDGKALQISFALLSDLLGPALAIAMLGAIESLLCGVIADGMTGTRHRPNAELVGQGIGNIVTPLFGRHYRHSSHRANCHQRALWRILAGCRHGPCAGCVAGRSDVCRSAVLPAHGCAGGLVADRSLEHE